MHHQQAKKSEEFPYLRFDIETEGPVSTVNQFEFVKGSGRKFIFTGQLVKELNFRQHG